MDVSALSHWESFYVIVGSSGAGLTGLMFVVITLIAGSSMPRSLKEINAFGTPSVVHFCAVLGTAAVMSAPWAAVRSPAMVIGLIGGAGFVYSLIVVRRMRRTTSYAPVLEDLIWHIVLPLLAYLGMTISGLALGAGGETHPWALYGIAAVSLMLLFIGIHNAWDTVVYLVVTREAGSGKG